MRYIIESDWEPHQDKVGGIKLTTFREPHILPVPTSITLVDLTNFATFKKEVTEAIKAQYEGRKKKKLTDSKR